MAIEFDKSKVYLHNTGLNQWVCTITSIRKGYVDYEHNISISPGSSSVLHSGGHNSLGKGIRLATEDEIRKANRCLQDLGYGYRFPANKSYEPWYDVF